MSTRTKQIVVNTLWSLIVMAGMADLYLAGALALVQS